MRFCIVSALILPNFLIFFLSNSYDTPLYSSSIILKLEIINESTACKYFVQHTSICIGFKSIVIYSTIQLLKKLLKLIKHDNILDKIF